MAELVTKFEQIYADPDDLLLDPNNPRYQGDFPDFVFVPFDQIDNPAHQKKALTRLSEKRFNVKELSESIAEVGYLPIDRLVVIRYKGTKFLVIEGNRRLAAIKLILDGKTKFKAGNLSDLHKIPAVLLKESYESVSVDQWLIQGTRHIGGVKEWGPYQKARALQTLLKNKGLTPKEAAAALGLSTSEANKSLRSLTAFESIEADSVFGERLKPADFSSFEEMLAKPDLRDYFGWSNSKLQFVDSPKRELFLKLILGDPESDKPPKIAADIDLRKVPQILRYPEARQSLEDLSEPFEQAVYLSQTLEQRARITASLEAFEGWARSLSNALRKPTEAQREAAKRVRDYMDEILGRPR